MEDEDLRTIWCGNLSENVTEDLLYELFTQGGPVQKVSIPSRDGRQKNFGFITYKHMCSVPYALDLFDGTSLFNRTLNMKTRNNLPMNQPQALPPPPQQQQQQMFEYENIQRTIQNDLQRTIQNDLQRTIQNDLQLGQQMLLGSFNSMAFGMNPAFMMPAGNSYRSQNAAYTQGTPNSMDYSRSNRHSSRSHPYERDHYDNRRDRGSRHDSHRDHKSYKQSHRDRKKYR